MSVSSPAGMEVAVVCSVVREEAVVALVLAAVAGPLAEALENEGEGLLDLLSRFSLIHALSSL